MRDFSFQRLAAVEHAVSTVAARPGAMFLAGGTTLVDLTKVGVLTPDTLVDVRPLGMSSIDVSDDAIAVGATVTNSQLAWHPVVRDRYPVLSEATLAGATTQLRNMATVAGNILQRTRCPYFRDVHTSCNRRQPGTGCDALDGFNRAHAVLGVSEHCIATHPSDMCVAMAVLDAEIHTMRPDGTTRSIPFGDFHRAPGDTPHLEFALTHGELILNPKTARSQIIGGIAGGIGMALLEETVPDQTGRLVNTSLADYVVATNADVRDIDVLFVGQPDSMTPVGTKGVGELALTGMPAAIANAVYHATGTRVRALPISIEKMLEHESYSGAPVRRSKRSL